MQYRAEIDGLRALAVVPVVLFHAGITGFSGGFVGVDIFFVISGYLITSIILSEQQKDSFTLASFYERRARRILPALMFVVLISVIAAWYLLLPTELVDYGKSLISVGVFASNILFWQESDYFAATSEFIPLLHTWSLAVEEQFYLVFPLFMMATIAWLKRSRVLVLTALAVVSLLYCEWAWRHTPEANFFLAPSRAWELLAGVFCAFYLQHSRTISFGLKQVASVIGLFMTLFSIFFFTKAIPFPSFYALVPVVGTVLIILFAEGNTWVGRLLSLPVFVGIGLVSYSAYLWHQPLFVFARISSYEELAPLLLVGLSVLAFVLAYISWRWVEKPFRNRHWLTQKQVLWMALLCSVVLIALGAGLIMGDGFNERFADL
ncbi:acyltransferase family protein [Leucothrix arctica]|uniref:Acyltransferase n=1 Tax=Leucothrix arctica TaxID=1481894 RepID=A0A317CMN0_9GAMM|nr:acyltransferase [Leucothrix arctica]PWQ99569.1 acyltransferase [Leucothrix arctica]